MKHGLDQLFAVLEKEHQQMHQPDPEPREISPIEKLRTQIGVMHMLAQMIRLFAEDFDQGTRLLRMLEKHKGDIDAELDYLAQMLNN